MVKRKVILLPDDARILDLFKGNIGAEKRMLEPYFEINHIFVDNSLNKIHQMK